MSDIWILASSFLAEKNAFFIAGGFFLWGLGSALLSPCHLGVIPVLATHAAGYGPLFNHGGKKINTEQSVVTNMSYVHPVRQVLLFTAGCFVTIPILGVFFSVAGESLTMGGHWWTVPMGAVLIWFGMKMMQNHACSHPSHIRDVLRRRFGINSHSGFFALGFGYGMLASGCTVGFLTPLLLVTLSYDIIRIALFAACFGIGHVLPMAVIGCSAPLARHLLAGRERTPYGENVPDQKNGFANTDPLHDPHKGETWFRRIMGIGIILIGVYFILHPFLD